MCGDFVKNMPSRDLRTKGIILKRVDYGEADRILSILTPDGRFSVMARGVRKTRSKLAGGIEMLALVDLNIHFGKGEMGTLTSARTIMYYREILKNIKSLEVAGELIKKISKVAETMNGLELFEVLRQGLEGINAGMNSDLVRVWFILNVRRLVGEEANLYRDKDGGRLSADGRYDWNAVEMAFEKKEFGKYGVMEIKMLRLMTVSPLTVISRIKADSELVDRVVVFSDFFSEL